MARRTKTSSLHAFADNTADNMYSSASSRSAQVYAAERLCAQERLLSQLLVATQNDDDQICSQLSEILPERLYLTNYVIAAQPQFTPRGVLIRDIVNVAPPDATTNVFEHLAGYRYLRIPVLDLPNVDLSPFMLQACRFIERAVLEARPVLVHCQAGVSRSPTIVAAFLIYALHMSAVEAIEFVRERRDFINPNIGFLAQLETMQGRLRTLGARNSSAPTRAPHAQLQQWTRTRTPAVASTSTTAAPSIAHRVRANGRGSRSRTRRR